MTWAWSDAWVLAAAYVTQQNPVPLTDLIGAGDGINHAIFLDDEINGGLTRLRAAGLVQVDGETIVLTDEGVRLCERAFAKTASVLQATKNVEAELRQIDLIGRELKAVTLPPAAVMKAIEEYHKRAWAEYRRLRG